MAADPLIDALSRLGQRLVDAVELRRPLFDDEVAELNALTAIVETELAVRANPWSYPDFLQDVPCIDLPGAAESRR